MHGPTTDESEMVDAMIELIPCRCKKCCAAGKAAEAEGLTLMRLDNATGFRHVFNVRIIPATCLPLDSVVAFDD